MFFMRRWRRNSAEAVQRRPPDAARAGFAIHVARPAAVNRIVALYWDNIDPRLVETQRAVFAHFGYEIDQRERTGLNHGDFLDAYMTELGPDDVAC